MIRPKLHMFLVLIVPVQLAIVSVSFAGDAKILSAVGEVVVDRQDDSKQLHAVIARPKAKLGSSDTVRTGRNGGASLIVGNCIIYLGSGTSVQVNAGAGQPIVNVGSGQVRAVITGKPGLKILSASSQTTAAEGILRVSVDNRGTRVSSERGMAKIQHPSAPQTPGVALTSFADIETTTLQSGQQVVVPSKGAPSLPPPMVIETEDSEEDAIEVESLQDQAARSAEQAQQNQLAGTLPPVSTRGTSSAVRNVQTTQNNNVAAAPGQGFGFGAFSSATSSPAFGGGNADFFQRTNDGELLSSSARVQGEPNLVSGAAFDGSIQLVTAENQTENQLFESGALAESEYWSIASAIGNPVLSDFDILVSSVDGFETKTIAAQETISVGSGRVAVRYAEADLGPIDAVRNDFTFFIDSAGNGDNGNLSGDTPQDNIQLSSEGNPVNAAAVINDGKANLNSKLSYVLGRIFLSEKSGKLLIGIRGSDQDRKIEFSGNPDDVTANDDVTYRRATQDDVDADDNFGNGETELNDLLPGTYDRTVSLSDLGPNSKATLTQIMASSLGDFARRTGQTRFVADGQIIDISGGRLALRSTTSDESPSRNFRDSD